MHVLYPHEHLFEHVFYMLLFKLVCRDEIEQILPFEIFQDHIEIMGVFEIVEKADNVGVVAHYFQYLYFIHLERNFERFHLLFVDILNSDDLGRIMLGMTFVDLSEASLSYKVIFDIII